MPPLESKEKIILGWALFIIVNSIFYWVIISSTIGPCTTMDDSLLNNLGWVVVVVFFWANLKYFTKIPKWKKVISIIVIIMALTFFALISRANVSCSRGADAAIKASLASFRTFGEIYKDVNNSFAGFCTSKEANETFGKISQILINTKGDKNSVVCHDNETAWAAFSPLKSTKSPGVGFCVDSKNYAGESIFLNEGITSCQ